MLSFLIASVLGAALGFVAGLVPGFHANNLALILLWLSGSADFDPLAISLAIVCAGVAHSFSGFIPSIFLGAPSEETALAVSPGHRLLLSGRGFQALMLCIAGGILGLVAVGIGFFFLKSFAAPLYGAVKEYMGALLVLVSFLMILIEKRKVWAIFIFALAGVFGIVSLNSPVNSRFVLLPMLSGLFGASTLILSYKSAPKIPRQRMAMNLGVREAIHGAISGFFGGVLAGFLPGVGTSQSAIIAQRTTMMKGTKKFMISLGAIGASDVLLSVFALSFIGRTRSGIAAAVETLSGAMQMEGILLFLGAGLFAAGIAAIATMKAGRVFARRAAVQDTRKASFFVLLFLFALCAMFTGALGVLIFITGTSLGILPHAVGTKKSILISCLLLPTTLYFLGLDGALLRLLGL